MNILPKAVLSAIIITTFVACDSESNSIDPVEIATVNKMPEVPVTQEYTRNSQKVDYQKIFSVSEQSALEYIEAFILEKKQTCGNCAVEFATGKKKDGTVVYMAIWRDSFLADAKTTHFAYKNGETVKTGTIYQDIRNDDSLMNSI
jgi:hypothetical protein